MAYESENEDDQLDQWIRSSDAIRLVRTVTMSPTANIDIAKRAHSGLLRSRARLMIINEHQRYENAEVERQFWWANGHEALKQNWELGDFETFVPPSRVLFQVFGIEFHRSGLAQMVPSAFPLEVANSKQNPRTGGRPMAETWPSWVAEVALLIHSEGIPDGVGAAGLDEFIAQIEERLELKGLAYPARSTVQAAARAVLTTLRAEN